MGQRLGHNLRGDSAVGRLSALPPPFSPPARGNPAVLRPSVGAVFVCSPLVDAPPRLSATAAWGSCPGCAPQARSPCPPSALRAPPPLRSAALRCPGAVCALAVGGGGRGRSVVGRSAFRSPRLRLNRPFVRYAAASGVGRGGRGVPPRSAGAPPRRPLFAPSLFPRRRRSAPSRPSSPSSGVALGAAAPPRLPPAQSRSSRPPPPWVGAASFIAIQHLFYILIPGFSKCVFPSKCKSITAFGNKKLKNALRF